MGAEEVVRVILEDHRKPLHVRVAEVLGTVDSQEIPPFHYVTPKYDTDWSAGGPLIERFVGAMSFQPSVGGSWGAWARPEYAMAGNRPALGWVWSETPLLAVCHLILALAEAGKLPKERAPMTVTLTYLCRTCRHFINTDEAIYTCPGCLQKVELIPTVHGTMRRKPDGSWEFTEESAE